MKHCMSFAKGMGAGIVAGVTAAVAVRCACKNCRTLKRKTGKAARAMSDIMEDIQELLK